MATYAELNGILTDTTSGSQALRERVGVAGLIAAEIIIRGDDTSDPPWVAGGHEQRLKWARNILSSYESNMRILFSLVIAANAGFTQAQILSASDAAIQDSVNEAIDALASNLV